jgi:hypothetical protein
MPRRSSAVLALACAAALAPATSALADETFTATLPAGGTISTGPAVSPGDPAQLTLRVAEAGTVTITKTTSPAYPQAPRGSVYFGPRFDVSTQVRIDDATMLVDGSELPETFDPGATRASSFGWACLYRNPSAGRDYDCTEQADVPAGTVTPTDDLLIGLRPEGAPLDWSFGRPYTPFWLFLTKRSFLAQGFAPQKIPTMETLLRRRSFDVGWSCNWTCTGRWSASISPDQQRLLGLPSTTIASGALSGRAPGRYEHQSLDIPASKPFLKALESKGVTQIKFRFDYDLVGPGGEKPPAGAPLGGLYQLDRKTRRRSCVLIREGVKTSGGRTLPDLAVLRKKGRKCPRSIASTLRAPTVDD